ncbi:DUF4233 domain-containing protein [Leucobacter sp. USHLN153]|uniref:DUF4233 domain-containing protein n=1 Tax=Leucobacter sp. USHLN153 TaxID=3081268 RepID=UPI00301952DA
MSASTPAPGSPEGQPGDPELVLSPSETAAHNSAMRIASGRGAAASTQKALASIVLGFELFIVVLIGLTLFGLSTLEPRELGLYLGGGLAVVILVGLAAMRRGRAGIIIGWIVHALMLLIAIVLPMSLIVSVLFTALWVYCMVRGARIDRDRAAWMAAQGD